MLLVEGHYVVGVTLFWMGALVPSRQHLEEALAHYGPTQPAAHVSLYMQDPRVVCLIRLALDLWLLGYPEQAAQTETEALQVARELSHPFSLGYVQAVQMILWTLRHDARAVAQQAEECLALSREHGMVLFMAMATIMRGWALAEQGDAEAGIRRCATGLTAFRAGGNVYIAPFFLALMAQQYANTGRIERGLTLVSEALAAVERTGERWYEAELYRMRAEQLLARDDHGRGRGRISAGARHRPLPGGESTGAPSRDQSRSTVATARPDTRKGANSSRRYAAGLTTACHSGFDRRTCGAGCVPRAIRITFR